MPKAKSKNLLRMSKDLVTAWDQRLRLDLEARRQKHDKQWEENSQVVRNTGEGFRLGNLVTDYMRVLTNQLFSRSWEAEIIADDPAYVKRAEDATVVCQSVARICSLMDNVLEATKDSMSANTGWLEVGHPMDPWSNDIMCSVFAPGVDQATMLPDTNMTDDYEEVDPASMQADGVLPDNVLPFSPLEEVPETDEPDEDPVPVFSAPLGYPWLKTVDPRLVLIPPADKKKSDLDYICRLRFITRPELKLLRGVDYGPASGTVYGGFRDLFPEVEGKDPLLFPEMMLICETWIIRDRNNPQFNNWYLCYVLGNPEWVLFNNRNPYGGMIPLIPLKLARHKAYLDKPPAEELLSFADMFDIGMKSVLRRMTRTLNEKYLVGNGAGLDPKESAKLNNDSYRGQVNVNDVNAVQRYKEETIDQAFIYYLNYIRDLAQSTTGQNSMDRGESEKNVTASQTRALLQASGISVEGMKQEIRKTASEVLMKLMHLSGIYNQQVGGKSYKFGASTVKMDRGVHDFVTSFIFDIRITDMGETDSEKQMLLNQFLRTMMSDTGGVLLPYLNLEDVAKRAVKVFEMGSSALASRGANRPGTGRLGSADPQVQAGLSGNAQLSGGAPGSLEGILTGGQHPERLMGSRGVNTANSLEGMRRVG